MNAVVSESLQIVGDELAVTLQDARQALEQFAEGEGGPNVLDRCVRMLHTIRGVLRMTETYGASLLAEEMEATCRHLARVKRDGAEEALDALSRAAVQLPAYVERILSGGRDIPLVLLPLLNDLRAARGKPLLSESTLLLLNVFDGDEATPVLPDRQPSGEDLAEVCRSLRPRFQLALLGWIKGADGDRALAQMAEIASRLEKASTAPEVHRLWWVVSGVLESLRAGTLATSVSLKRLMGQTDREIKRLMTGGEERFAAQPPRELINNFLYYIARVTEPSPRVSEIRAVFNLGELVPADDQVEAVRESLAAPSAKLMQTVAEAIREDLARVKDVLDIYLRTGMSHPEELAPQVEMLKKIGDTLGVLGLGELREIIATRRDELDEIATGRVEAEEARLVGMAAALLSVEHRLDEQLLRLIAPQDETGAERPAAQDVDYDEVIRAVMRECVVNLSRVQDAITQVLERPGEGSILDTVPPLLRGITAGLLILDKSDAVELLEDIESGIQSVIHQGEASPDNAALDLLADAIVSLHYYMETLEAGRREPTYMLDNARRCLLALRESPALPKVDGVSTGMVTTLQLSEPSATVEALDPKALASLPGTGKQEERPDPEIIELFIEEAGEEIESIRQHYARWAEDLGDEEALVSIRRSFHTLKGSGRMVGAGLMGEFAWSLENLLNRVINKTLDNSPAIVELVGEAGAALPQLLEQLEVGEPLQVDVGAIMERAARLAEVRAAGLESREEPADEPGAPEFEAEEEAAEADLELEPTEQDTAEEQPGIDDLTVEFAVEDESWAEPGDTDRGPTEPVPEGIDPVLLEILAKEVGGHLEVIRKFIAECRAGTPPFTVPEALYRACHTLHGSVTMARAEQAAAVSGPLNRLIRHAYDHSMPIGQPVLEACADATAMLSSVMGALADASLPMPDTAELESRLATLDEEIEKAAASASAEAEETVEAPAESPADTPAFDADIAGIFADEAGEILESADATLARLASGEPPASMLEEMQRYLHTLKGGARMAGLTAMGDLSHDLEALVIGAASGRLSAGEELRALLQAAVDELHHMREQVTQGIAPRAPAELLGRLAAMLAGEEAAAEAAEAAAGPVVAEPAAAEPETAEAAGEEAAEPAEEVPPPEEAPPVPAMPVLDQIGQLARELKEPAQPSEAGGLQDLLPPSREPVAPERKSFARVDPEVLQQLLNNAGEISIFHSRLMQQMSQVQFHVEELGQTVVRLRDQLRSLELATEAQILYLHQADMAKDENFDPLELDRYSKIQQLSRALAETASDVNSLKDMLGVLTADTEGLLVQQSRTANELQDGLMRTRMVPFQEHGARLARLVRQTAAEHGKQAELQLEGGGELDRQVLEKMLPPFEHMLRNAVIHGIEPPPQREQAGKPRVGSVAIQLRREGSEVVIEVKDDGYGLDVEAIRQKALEQGLVDPDEKVTDEEVMQFILRSGFSTAGSLTQAAGRGIGMDVVASEIAKLGGTLRMQSERGRGTTFSIRLPFTLAVTQALIVRAGSELYALPLPTVEGIIRISRTEFDQYMASEDPAIDYAGQRYHFRHLGQFVGTGPSRLSDDVDRVSLILVRAGDNSTALITDEMLDSREIVVKPVGAQLATIRGISGATILGDGRVIVILDAGALVRALRPPLEQLAPDVEERPAEPIALVVDDSITMRRVTQRLLERNHFHVVTAKDGVEAIGALQEQCPDIILLDVEMPRMDGYEFATHVRNNPGTQNVPIIMITSRVSEKHRARAIELGVNDYLGKPYQEQALMDAVRHLLDLPAE